MDILIMNGFEAYTVRDHKRARNLLMCFPNSIMFINIDEGLKEKEWEAYIRELQENEKTRGCRLGILSYNTDRALMQKYLMDMSIPCGYIHLKLGIQESTKIILNALIVNEARGKRRYIRASCEDEPNATMNYQTEEGTRYGKLLDISSAGIAVKIDHFGNYPPNTLFRNVQLKLRGSLVMINAILMGKRRDDQDVWIFLFDPHMTPESKLTIHHFIKQNLQRYIDQLPV
ncbi:MAG: PilZ domain-containing protein [Treponema sp.]|nr:PilZ domain-containing protein [Treponema sp.]